MVTNPSSVWETSYPTSPWAAAVTEDKPPCRVQGAVFVAVVCVFGLGETLQLVGFRSVSYGDGAYAGSDGVRAVKFVVFALSGLTFTR